MLSSTTIHNTLRRSIHPSILSSHPHHADLGHLSLQLGSRHVLEVVVIAALPAPGICLHDEMLHVQRPARDARRVHRLADRRAELGGSVVPAGLLRQKDGGRGKMGKEFIHLFVMSLLQELYRQCVGHRVHCFTLSWS